MGLTKNPNSFSHDFVTRDTMQFFTDYLRPDHVPGPAGFDRKAEILTDLRRILEYKDNTIAAITARKPAPRSVLHRIRRAVQKVALWRF